MDSKGFRNTKRAEDSRSDLLRLGRRATALSTSDGVPGASLHQRTFGTTPTVNSPESPVAVTSPTAEQSAKSRRTSTGPAASIATTSTLAQHTHTHATHAHDTPPPSLRPPLRPSNRCCCRTLLLQPPRTPRCRGQPRDASCARS